MAGAGIMAYPHPLPTTEGRCVLRTLMASALPVAGLILAGPLAGLANADAGAPITVAVRSSLEGQKGLGRIFSAAGSGDVARTSDDVEMKLQNERWLRMVNGDEAEVLVTITQRERIERSHKVDKEGRESIDHRYT